MQRLYKERCLFHFPLPKCCVYWRAAFKRGNTVFIRALYYPTTYIRMLFLTFSSAPPKNEDAPDLYEMMGSLDGGDTELNSKASPPSLFGTAQQQEMHRYVEELKLGLAEEEISEYLDEFEKQVEEEVLMIGSISLEEVQVGKFFYS